MTAAGTLACSLARELAPIRVNAISPGVIDTGAWDALGEQGKQDYFAQVSAFLTGQALHIDGGEPLS